jgi:hypothetical protein
VKVQVKKLELTPLGNPIGWEGINLLNNAIGTFVSEFGPTNKGNGRNILLLKLNYDQLVAKIFKRLV